MTALKSLIFTFLVPGTVAVLVPYRLGSSATATGNLPSGAFRYSVGVLSVLFGEAIWFEARVLFEYAGLVFVLFFAFVVFYEEPALTRKFGNSYERYRKAVPRWIPRLRAAQINRS